MTKNEYIASIMLEAADLLREDTVNEDIETFFVRNDIWRKGTVTLYHSTPYKVNTILPRSLNAGTRLSRIRNSSFWSTNPVTALAFGISHVLSNSDFDNYEYGYINNDLKIIIDIKYKDQIIEILKKNSVYLYTYNADSKKIGIGQAMEIEEFTIDTEVIPDSIRIATINELENVIIFMDTNDTVLLNKYTTQPKARFMQKIIQYKDWSMRRHMYSYRKITKKPHLIRWLLNNMIIAYDTDLKFNGIPIIVDSKQTYNEFYNNLAFFQSRMNNIPNPPPGYKVDFIAVKSDDTNLVITFVSSSSTGNIMRADIKFNKKD